MASSSASQKIPGPHLGVDAPGGDGAVRVVGALGEDLRLAEDRELQQIRDRQFHDAPPRILWEPAAVWRCRQTRSQRTVSATHDTPPPERQDALCKSYKGEQPMAQGVNIDAKQVEALNRVAERFFTAVEKGDVDTVKEIYSPDARIWHNFDNYASTREENLGC